ncbi:MULTISPECIES: hypothetical protein [Pantoea]|jgi:hypothetical protein|uniref:DUF4440 domain-containing protein n=1 Tax=Pantoea eucrina TaxID=472693 RepID=A0ABS1Z3Z2_9GAMM|nr:MULTISPECIES: hypothetical protein [Pantoea]PPS58189.1 hypothetical protein CRX72_11470 [Pantoea sp. BRM17]AIX50576.1 hypothetical protein PSNIH1_10230 [Pantoea sp. PSNIH1]MBM0747112.1 hypothetical protein [Pantoea eucrina]MCL9646390.1 hypothetical protein [Pantoea eucrina]MDJ0022078.1 hypothetical protein [Pantoea eucrina]
MTSLAQEAKHSVVVLHQLIERIFNHADVSNDTMGLLLSHFHPDFRMVTPQGRQLNLNDVEDLFRRLCGQREGMRIATSEHAIISEQQKEVTIQYRELQILNGESHSRISLAVLDCTTENPRWRYLQETLVA